MSDPGLLKAGFALAFLCVPAVAQSSAKKDSPKQDFSKEGAVIEQTVTRVFFESDGTSTREQRTRVRVQSDAGAQQYGVLRFPYEASVERIEILDVRVTKADRSVVATPPDSIQDTPSEVSHEAPFYSDLREKHVAVKGLGPGDTLEYTARWQLQKPLAPGQFWFSYQFLKRTIILDEQLEISVPREREVRVKSQTIQPTSREETGRRIYTWKTSHLESESAEKQKGDQSYDSIRGLLPPPDVLISSFRTWEEVGRWYERLQQEKIQPSPEVKVKAQEVTKGLSDDDARLRAIYNYVSLRYRYIGIAFGMGRYQPHSAAEILGNQYGDCKDKHTLLAALLSAIEMRAYPALINSHMAVDADVPSPAQFDHVISVVAKGGTLSWMDTTSEVAPFGYLLVPLRDKPALVITPEKVAFQTTPSTPPFASKEEFQIAGKLSADGTLEAHAQSGMRSDGEYLVRLAFRRVPQAQWKDLVQTISYSSGFAGTVSDIEASSPENTQEPFKLTYNYYRKDYSDWENHRILAALPPFGLPSLKDEELSRDTPLWLDGPGEWQYESRIELPKGFSAELPPPLNLKEGFAEFQGSSEVKDGVLVIKRHLLLKARQVSPNELKSYKAFQKAIWDDQFTYIPLKTANDFATTLPQRPVGISGLLAKALTELPSSSNPEAVEAENDARDAMQQTDRSSAIAALKHAVALDPNFSRAWIELGGMYAGTPEKSSALDAFRNAVAAEPKQVVPYKLLAFACVADRRPGEAIAVWQKLQSVAPDDRDIAPNLGGLLLGEKRYKEAASLFESATKAAPYNAYMEANLGIARIRAGDAENGLVAVRRALELDSSAEMLNNVAYEMAEADTDLPGALDYSQRSVKEVEARSQKVDLDHIQKEDLQLPLAIGAYWDTLGWIYYKMGDLVLAESYLNSAWQLRQDGLVGDHLGQVYEKQRRLQVALHLYSLALEANPRLPETPKRMRNLAHVPLPTNQMSAGEELSRMRTIKLSRIIKGTATADFDVLLVPSGRIEKATFVRGSELLRYAGESLQKAPFKEPFPPSSTAHLVRRGILSCSSYSGCSFVFYPASVAAGAN